LDEAAIDDSNDPRYYAMRALGVLMGAVDASDTAMAVVAAQDVCACIADLADDLDFILAADGQAGGVHVAERRAAQSVLAALSSDASVASSVDSGSLGAANFAFRRAAQHLSAGHRLDGN